ncbi:MAG: cell surface protein SprA, partial [Owenweeksia sp.]
MFTLSAVTRTYPSVKFNDEPWNQQVPADSADPDSTLPYPFDSEEGGLYLKNPANYKEEVDYDPETGQYIVTQKIGNLVARPPMFMTPEEYRAYVARKQVDDYWKSKTQSEEAAKAEGRDPSSSLIPQIQVNSETFARIFGSNTIDIRPQGYAQLSFGGRIQNVDNPLIPERNRSTFNFDFDQRIQMNVTGKIGEKLQITTNYDTEATFSFENQMKVEFTGDEDDIVKKVELGNVSLPLNSSLISGAQSLFGVKGQFQFGKLRLTGVFSEQRSQSSSINVQGGATTTEFEINADQYEANKHFFLSQYFRDNYERFLTQMPLITSPVQITKVEVWV